MFALVDANSFYCSAEQVFRPDWRGKPIVVLSNNDGCVVAANRQAKAAGIEKFKPWFQVKALAEQHGVIACSSNYELYSDLSAKMMQIVGQFAPRQHIYSIDETFLDLTGMRLGEGALLELGAVIRRTVWREARLPVGVGFGDTLTLAKAANHAAKRIEGFNGVCAINSESTRKSILSEMHVSDVWGIGRKLSKRLESMGIMTALQLSKIPIKLARKQFSVEVERLVLELNGTPTRNWDETRADKQQIFSTRSTGERIEELDSLKQAFAMHVSKASQKARQQHSVAGAILVFAHNSPFDDGCTRGFKQLLRFPLATNDSLVIGRQVAMAIPRLYVDGVRYYKIGVGLVDLMPQEHVQYDLFTPPTEEPRLMCVLDKLNQRYGSDTVFVAAQGIDPKWHMRRDMLTPQYTTDWRQIPLIQCR